MCFFSSSYIKKIIFLVFTTLILTSTSYANVKIFGSKDCVECTNIKKSLKDNNIKYSFVDVESDEGYETLLDLEKSLKISSSGDLPAVYTTGKSNKIFYFNPKNSIIDSVKTYNIQGIKNKIADTIKYGNNLDTKKINIVFFEKDGCSACSRVDRHLKYLIKKDRSINIMRYKISNKKNSELNKLLCDKYSVNEQLNMVTPAIFTDNGFIIGKKVNSINIDSLLAIPITKPSNFWKFSKNEYKRSSKEIEYKFSKMSIYVVIFAALLDSINPCAYATLIFLISYLLAIKKDKKTILFSGIAFSLSVFITYTLVGFGLLQVATFMGGYYTARLILNSIIILALLYYGFLNLYDFIMIKRKKYNKIKLSLSFDSSQKINKSIRSLSKSKFIIINSFLIGFVISFLELACTGQEYLPTIIYMKETVPQKAIPYLLLYNVVFILPILFIFIMIFKGLTTSSLQKFILKHSASVKLGFFFLMIFMASIIIFTQLV